MQKLQCFAAPGLINSLNYFKILILVVTGFEWLLLIFTV